MGKGIGREIFQYMFGGFGVGETIWFLTRKSWLPVVTPKIIPRQFHNMFRAQNK